MKRAIYIILLLLYTTLVHAYMYQSNMPTYQPQTRIGYTTNYSNGQFTPSAYQNFNTSTYSGTYNPYSNGNTNNGGSGRPGQPRKAPAYDPNGGYLGDTPFDFESGWEYYNYNGEWYRYGDRGWDLFWHWGMGYQKWNGHYWSNISGSLENFWNDVGSNGTHAYDYNPVPIGEPTTPLLLLMFAYLSYHEIKKRRHCKHFFFVLFSVIYLVN